MHKNRYMQRNNIVFVVLSAALILIAGWTFFLWSDNTKDIPVENVEKVENVESKAIEEIDISTVEKDKNFVAPMDRFEGRVTKKDFGMYITPETSPVADDNFRGFHTGVDWEIFNDEMDVEVPIRTICSGKLTYKKFVSGYGGAAVQECELEENYVTVIYGHMDLASIKFAIGEKIEAGKILGNLGEHKSVETDGARKHLHLGIHNGGDIELRGYVGSNEELSRWIDPCLYICKK